MNVNAKLDKIPAINAMIYYFYFQKWNKLAIVRTFVKT